MRFYPQLRARPLETAEPGHPDARFRCEKLSCELSERACGGRHARAEAIRPGHVLRHDQIGLVECRGCSIGAAHLERHGEIPPMPLRMKRKTKLHDDGSTEEVARVAIALDARRAKKVRKRQRSRAVCVGCGGPKDGGAGRRYCVTCRERRAGVLGDELRERQRAWRRQQLGTPVEAQRTGACQFELELGPCAQPTRGPWDLYCEACKPEAKRRNDREYRRRLRRQRG